MDSEEEIRRVKRSGLSLESNSSKKQKADVAKQEKTIEKEKELTEEQLQHMMSIVPYEGMNVEALQDKHQIIYWEIYSDDSGKYWKIIRFGNLSEVYKHC